MSRSWWIGVPIWLFLWQVGCSIEQGRSFRVEANNHRWANWASFLKIVTLLLVAPFLRIYPHARRTWGLIMYIHCTFLAEAQSCLPWELPSSLLAEEFPSGNERICDLVIAACCERLLPNYVNLNCMQYFEYNQGSR